MKKIFLVSTIILASAFTSGCVNNLAIQELNNKAKAYMDAGDVEKAICRYHSSLDLDGNIFETNYNLGVAYVEAKKYSEAAETLKNAIKLKPSFADSYYSLAVALENIAYEKINGTDEKQQPSEEAGISETDVNEAGLPAAKELSAQTKEEITKLFMDSIENYNQYLTLDPAASDKETVAGHVEELNRELLKYSQTNTPADEG